MLLLATDSSVLKPMNTTNLANSQRNKEDISCDWNNARLCFFTLTTRNDKNEPKNRFKRIKDQNYAFTKLEQKIERYLQNEMYLKHCRKYELSPFELHGSKKSIKYPRLYARFRFRFKYFKLKTAEGGGVMHIIFRKAYNVPRIRFEWLSSQWTRFRILPEWTSQKSKSKTLTDWPCILWGNTLPSNLLFEWAMDINGISWIQEVVQ